jgi:hypothetical protein
MGKLWAVIRKNYKTSIRNPEMTLAIIFGPILFVILIGLSYQSSALTSNINIGLYTPHTESTSLIETALQNVDKLNLVKVRSEQECTTLLQKHLLHACLIISYPDPDDRYHFDAKMILDYSRSSITLIISDTLKNIISTMERQIIYQSVSNMRLATDSQNLGFGEAKEQMEFFKTLISSTKNDVGTISDKINAESTRVRLQLLTTGNNLQQAYNDISNSESDLILQQSKVRAYREKVTLLKTKTSNARNNIQNAWRITCNNQGTNYYPAITENFDYSKLSADTQSICSMEATFYYMTVDYDNQLAILENDLTNADSMISNTIAQIESTKSQIQTYNLQVSNEVNNVNAGQLNIQTYLDAQRYNLDNAGQREEGITASIDKIQSLMNGLNAALNPDKLSNPIKQSIATFTNNDTKLAYLFPVIICFIVMMTSLLIGLTVRYYERKSAASKRNELFADMKYIVMGDFIFVLILILTELLVIFIGFKLFFGLDSLHNIHIIIFTIILYIIIWILVGFILAEMYDSLDTAIFVSVTVGILIFMMSDVLIPLEVYPKYLAFFTSINPFMMLAELLRINYVSSVDVTSEALPINVGFIVTIAVLIIVLWITKIYKKNQNKN